METHDAEYLQQVTIDGYKWQQYLFKHKTVLCLLESHSVSGPSSKGITTSYKYVPIMRNLGLFRRFARLNIKSRVEVLSFANKYGMLGLDTHYDRELGETVETASSWHYDVTAMSICVAMMDAIRTESSHIDACTLAKYIHWESDTHPEFSYPYYDRVRMKSMLEFRRFDDGIVSSYAVEHFFSELPPGSLLKPAREAIRKLVNDNLRGHIYYQMQNSIAGTQLLVAEPTSLHGALWLQFAHAMVSNEVECPICHKKFVPTRKGHVYCNDACRKRASRRQAE
ncbi:MAG: hypothetical protein ABFD54_14760 [Armatimonadota bacterium]|nr:hypothetical protein [bacterium]